MAYCNLALGLLLFILPIPLAATRPPPWQYICDFTSNYTLNSTYQATMQYLASSLPEYTSGSPNLFATGRSGTAPDEIYALALCRGDSNASSCAVCISSGLRMAQEQCPLMKKVVIFTDSCILRMSNEAFQNGQIQSDGDMVVSDDKNVSAAMFPTFFAAAFRLLNATIDYAAYDPVRRFGTGVEAFDESYPKIYAQAQCTPDLTAQRCLECLKNITRDYMRYDFFFGKQGGKVLGVWCNFRYETYPFFNGQPIVQLQSPFELPPSSAPQPVEGLDSSEDRSRDERTRVLLAILVPIVVLAIGACLYFWRLRRRREEKLSQPNSTSSDDIPSIDSLLIDLSTLRAATDNFSIHKKLGEGGFGMVYKGELPDGQEIAVKRLSETSRQGIEELKTELLLVAKLNHKHLVRLVGFCMEEHEKIVVYEYMPNRSLDTFIFDAVKGMELDWSRRFKIIKGITRGLQYLHEDSQLTIVHRDLKASNILLDGDYNPKISDFGLAKIYGGDQSGIFTHKIAGTFGYMSPEYVMHGRYSTRSDVFSLGVLILEIITGIKNSRFYNSDQDVDLLNSNWQHWTRDKAMELLDPALRNSCQIDELLKCIHVGLLCVQKRPANRPSMSAVNSMLTSTNVHLPPVTRPAFAEEEIGTNSANARNASSNDVTITELSPR